MATEFVGWYNGHPDCRELDFDLSCRRAVVIGNGDVALDMARMLARSPDELATTDAADHALDALRASAIEEIVVVGRRGPAQAAFGNVELRELGELADADVVVDPADVVLDDRCVETAGPIARRNVEVLAGFARRRPAGKRKRVVLRFLRSPVAIVGEQAVEAVELAHNELRRDADGAQRAHSIARRETIEAGLVLRSIGYRGTPLDGVSFDEVCGTIPNEGGRVHDLRRQRTIRGEYVVGWIKRGPSGLIGTTKRDAKETVGRLVEDIRSGQLIEAADPAPESIEQLLRARAVRHVSHQGWEAIDRVERAAGEPAGRPRVKLCVRAREQLLAAARSGDVTASTRRRAQSA